MEINVKCSPARLIGAILAVVSGWLVGKYFVWEFRQQLNDGG